MSIANFIKYTGLGPTPRMYIFSCNAEATIIESDKPTTQLALLTSEKTSNSISFISTYSNIGVYDKHGPMFFVGRQSLSSNARPRLDTSGSMHATDGFWVDGRQVVNSNAEVFSSNLFVQTRLTTSNIQLEYGYSLLSSNAKLEFGAPAGLGNVFSYQYASAPRPALQVAEQEVTAPRVIVGTGTDTEAFTVLGRSRINSGLVLTRENGVNVLKLSENASQTGPRMVVFREFGQNYASGTYAGIGYNGNMVYTTASTDQSHRFMVTFNETREVMSVGSDTLGNPIVGIGFTTAQVRPSVPLHVKGNSRFEGDMFVTGRFEGPTNLATLDESKRIRISDLPTRIVLLNSNSKIDDQYLPTANCNLNLYRSSLNVGVGTNAPKQKLHVTGNVYVESGRIGVGIQNPAYPLDIRDDSSTNALHYSYSGAGGDHLLFETSNAITPQSGVEKLLSFVVTHDGRVGIQTRPDNQFALDVNGAIKATGLTIPNVTIATVIASNIQSGGLTTNTNLNGLSNATKLDGYTVSSDRLGVQDITAYPDPDAGSIYVKNRFWLSFSPYTILSVPNQNVPPVPLQRADIFNVLSGIRGYTIQVGPTSSFTNSLLYSELAAALPGTVLYDVRTNTNGYQMDQMLPYIFGGLRELVIGQVAGSNLVSQQVSQLDTDTSNLKLRTTALEAGLLASSNQTVALQGRVASLEQQVAELTTRLNAIAPPPP